MTTTKLLLREVDWVDSECETVMGYFEAGEGSRHFPSGSATLFAGSDHDVSYAVSARIPLPEIAPLAYNMDVKDADGEYGGPF